MKSQVPKKVILYSLVLLFTCQQVNSNVNNNDNNYVYDLYIYIIVRNYEVYIYISYIDSLCWTGIFQGPAENLSKANFIYYFEKNIGQREWSHDRTLLVKQYAHVT